MDILKTAAGAIGGMAALMAATTGAFAQNGQAPAQSSQQSPATIPGLDTFNLPGQPPRPTPLAEPEPKIAPLPRPTPTPVATPLAVVPPPVRPTVRPTPPAPATPKPVPRLTETAPVATSTSAATPTPIATPSPTRTPIVVETPAAPPPASARAPWLALGGAGVAIAALLAGLWFLSRRHRAKRALPELREIASPPAASVAQPQALLLSDPMDLPRARVAIELEVKRAGTNLLSAAVEYRIILRNIGDADARAVAVDLRLLGIEPTLEAGLAALFSTPIAQPVVARFDLAPTATAALEGTAMLPRSAMPPLAIAGKALFVPVMTINLEYGWDGGVEQAHGQTAVSFVVGLDRGEGQKLGPFRLDGPPRMYDRVSQLPFTVSRES